MMNSFENNRPTSGMSRTRVEPSSLFHDDQFLIIKTFHHNEWSEEEPAQPLLRPTRCVFPSIVLPVSSSIVPTLPFSPDLHSNQIL